MKKIPSGIDNNILRGGKDIRLEPTRKDLVFKSINHTFNPLIHVMVPHSSGEGFVQKLKSDL